MEQSILDHLLAQYADAMLWNVDTGREWISWYSDGIDFLLEFWKIEEKYFESFTVMDFG